MVSAERIWASSESSGFERMAVSRAPRASATLVGEEKVLRQRSVEEGLRSEDWM